MKSPREADVNLSELCLLVVEDEYFIAVDVCEILTRKGATVLGPVSSIAEAEAKVAQHRPDGAVLDVNLRGETVFGFADRLEAAGVPVLYVTGYDIAALPPDRRQAVVLGKPVDAALLARSADQVFRTSARDSRQTESN